MLEQALSCSGLADVRFVFDDGQSLVSGHRGMLCGVSSEFKGMFESGMLEAQTGRVNVPGVSRESFRGFLELVYLGRAGAEMARADGRELWLLGDLYNVRGVKDWLTAEGLDGGSVCAAAQYALDGACDAGRLLEACLQRAAAESLGGLSEGLLAGVGAKAAGALLDAFLAGILGCPCVGFAFVERWASANGGRGMGNADVEALIGRIDLVKMRDEDLLRAVRPSGLVSPDRLLDVWQRRAASKLEGRTLGLVRKIGEGSWYSGSYVAVSPKRGDHRVAVCDTGSGMVKVFNVGSGECVMTVENLAFPQGLAFNGRGELLVSEEEAHRVSVWDEKGALVRVIGIFGVGDEDGQLSLPLDVAVNGDGDVIVIDESCRIQIFREDGRFVMSFKVKDDGSREPGDRFGLTVGRNGRIFLADSGNFRVKIFSPFGSPVMTLHSKGKENEGYAPAALEDYMLPAMVDVNQHGEILVVDERKQGDHEESLSSTLRVLSEVGALVRSITAGDIRDVNCFQPSAACFDGDGRIYVCNDFPGQKALLLIE